MEDRGVPFDAFQTSLPLRLDYEAMLAYILLPPAGPVLLLLLEHKSDYVRYGCTNNMAALDAVMLTSSSADSTPGNQACSLLASLWVHDLFTAFAVLANLHLDCSPRFLMVSSSVMDLVRRRSSIDWLSSFACVS
jgi:hypothetical protein